MLKDCALKMSGALTLHTLEEEGVEGLPCEEVQCTHATHLGEGGC